MSVLVVGRCSCLDIGLGAPWVNNENEKEWEDDQEHRNTSLKGQANEGVWATSTSRNLYIVKNIFVLILMQSMLNAK